jgi:hypothetical protein
VATHPASNLGITLNNFGAFRSKPLDERSNFLQTSRLGTSMSGSIITQQQLVSPGSKRTPISPASDGPEDNWSDESGPDGGSLEADGSSRKRRRTANRPLSVSCETCKQRKVKCDRGHPSCGWCQKNNQPCEYRERKKPGLRAVIYCLLLCFWLAPFI